FSIHHSTNRDLQGLSANVYLQLHIRLTIPCVCRYWTCTLQNIRCCRVSVKWMQWAWVQAAGNYILRVVLFHLSKHPIPSGQSVLHSTCQTGKFPVRSVSLHKSGMAR